MGMPVVNWPTDRTKSKECFGTKVRNVVYQSILHLRRFRKCISKPQDRYKERVRLVPCIQIHTSTLLSVVKAHFMHYLLITSFILKVTYPVLQPPQM